MIQVGDIVVVKNGSSWGKSQGEWRGVVAIVEPPKDSRYEYSFNLLCPVPYWSHEYFHLTPQWYDELEVVVHV